MQVERDGSEVVGLSLHMWLLLLLFVVVSGKIGWATWLFLILAGHLLALVNSLLLTRLRQMTRGGHVRNQHKVGGMARWHKVLLQSLARHSVKLTCHARLRQMTDGGGDTNP